MLKENCKSLLSSQDQIGEKWNIYPDLVVATLVSFLEYMLFVIYSWLLEKNTDIGLRNFKTTLLFQLNKIENYIQPLFIIC